MTETPITLRGGLLPPTPAKPRLRLSRHLTAAATQYPTPAAVDYLSAVPEYPLYANDRIGNCGPISVAHFITAAGTYGDGTPYVAPFEEVIDLYSRVTGYNPTTGANDTGVVMQDMLNEARKGGLGPQQILAFAEVDLSNSAEVRAAIHLFGGVLIGAWLPTDAERQFQAGLPWTATTGPTGQPGSWGGHAIHVGAFDDQADRMLCTTWGQVQALTSAWWSKYVLEAWVVVTPEFLREDGKTPAGLDLHGLGEELARITGGENPFPAPPEPVPAPEPVVPVAPADDEPEAPAVVDVVEQQFAEAITPWLKSRRYGANRDAQNVVRAYLNRKGF